MPDQLGDGPALAAGRCCPLVGPDHGQPLVEARRYLSPHRKCVSHVNSYGWGSAGDRPPEQCRQGHEAGPVGAMGVLSQALRGWCIGPAAGPGYRHYPALAAMPTIGLLRSTEPVEPWKPASPKEKMPPSLATSQ